MFRYSTVLTSYTLQHNTFGCLSAIGTSMVHTDYINNPDVGRPVLYMVLSM